MANNIYTGSINLSLLEGAFLKTMKGKTAEKMCICIPVEDAKLVSGQKGIYLGLTVFENDADRVQFGQTHSIKQNFTKEQREAMGDKQTPYLGNLKPLQKEDLVSLTAAAEAKSEEKMEVDDDLPF